MAGEKDRGAKGGRARAAKMKKVKIELKRVHKLRKLDRKYWSLYCDGIVKFCEKNGIKALRGPRANVLATISRWLKEIDRGWPHSTVPNMSEELGGSSRVESVGC